MGKHNASNERVDALERMLLSSMDGNVFARSTAAEMVHTALDNDNGWGNIEVAKLWTPEHNVVGPMGGYSSRVKLFLNLDGEIAPVIINVYSDRKIKDALVEQLQVDAQDAKLRKMIRKS